MSIENKKLSIKEDKAFDVLEHCWNVKIPREEFEFDKFEAHIDLNSIMDKLFDLRRMLSETVELDLPKLNITDEEKRICSAEFNTQLNKNLFGSYNGLYDFFNDLINLFYNFDFEFGYCDLLRYKRDLEALINFLSPIENLILLRRTHTKTESFSPILEKIKDIDKDITKTLEKHWHIVSAVSK
jgi:hypothetical protein